MRPVTDRHNVSRAKLAYLIDATAAPVCIIAPISSWAAAVTGFVEGEDGFSIFIRAIPYNFYALFTIAMMIILVVMKFDYGPMAAHEKNAMKGDLFSTGKKEEKEVEVETANPNGKVMDLVVPILVLIICCIVGMIYTGGFFSGADFVTAFSNSDARSAWPWEAFLPWLSRLFFTVCAECWALQTVWPVFPMALKHGSCDSDSYLCLDAEGHDGQPRSG